MAQITRDNVVMHDVSYSIEILDSNSDPAGGLGIGPIRVESVVSLDQEDILGLLDSAAESLADAVFTALGSGYTANLTRTLVGSKSESL